MKYFDTKHKKIIETSVQPFRLPDRFVRLTDEQLCFLEENPTASYYEVENCKKHELSLGDLKQSAIEHFSNLSFEHVESIIPAYRVSNALAGVYDEETTPKASDILENYKTISKKSRERFHYVKSLIVDSVDIVEINRIIQTCNYEDIIV